MADIKIKMVGLDKVRKNFEKLGADGKKAFRGAMYAKALNIVADATENAPAVTGRLRNSHYVSLPDARGSLTLGFGTNYAAAVEYGIHRPLKDASRAQQRAAWGAFGRNGGWNKSAVGGPSYFRRAINAHKSGIATAIAKIAKKLFAMRGGPELIPTTVPRKSKG